MLSPSSRIDSEDDSGVRAPCDEAADDAEAERKRSCPSESDPSESESKSRNETRLEETGRSWDRERIEARGLGCEEVEEERLRGAMIAREILFDAL